jgi:CubicO group peptidase (beta-lactamase class C family)
MRFRIHNHYLFITTLIWLITFSFLDAQSNNLQTALHQSQGFNSKQIVKADSFLSNYNRSNPVTHSFLLMRNGKFYFEKYYNGFNAERLNNLKSVTKSVTSLLIGIMIDRGLIKNEDEKISQLLPELFSYGKQPNENVDAKKKEITLKQVLTMSAGFEWNNFGGKWRSGWDKSKEPSRFLIQQVPLKNEIGKVWNYNSALSHLLSGLIKKSSGMNTIEFARKNLFEPLGIKNVRWAKSSDGNEMGNSELFMTSRDLAKIGQLFLQNGIWEGKQIISEEWIRKSTQKYFDGFPQIGGYGYQWHTRNFGKYSAFLAAGYGGQFLVVIPDLQIVIVNTSKWNVAKSTYIIFETIEKYIIPSIK